MNDLNDLISKATELHEKGLRSGEIADELNISRETATWLLTRSKTSLEPMPKDLYVNWSEIGQNAERLRFVSLALVDMILESGDPDVVVGVALSGLPLATLVADELGAELAVFVPRKQTGSENDQVTGSFSHNFADIAGKSCAIVDDVITTGSTAKELVDAIKELQAKPLSMAVIINKKGIDEVQNVPIRSLVKISIF
ncbi:MAG TPA: orotate phosphoribosyltransferase-like protein [Candidatus Acidoferrales bacterium]|jgi:orotate phosphoribosyltransferase|nr:orotate phosphoribosyltransferase-like protein [Candidatus Acidoferrales bacterium]